MRGCQMCTVLEQIMERRDTEGWTDGEYRTAIDDVFDRADRVRLNHAAYGRKQRGRSR